MEPIDVAKEKFLKIVRKDLPEYGETVISEADVRMKVIDPIFVEVLGWPKGSILLEEQAGMGEGKDMKGYIDYKCVIDDRNRLIIEAKRLGRDLGISPDRSARFFKLNGAVFDSKHAREGIEQAIRYCGHKGAELACVTNGDQWIIFLGNRRGDGKEILEGLGCVFGSLEGVATHFKRFYDLLSYEAVAGYRFRAEFQEAEGQPARTSSFRAPVRKPESRNLLPADRLYDDLERIMVSFFQDLRGSDDAEMRRECFVESDESKLAENSLARISEELRNRVQTIKQDRNSQITRALERVQQTKRQEFVLLVGTKGAGKSTFIERFFEQVLPSHIKRDCVVTRVDVGVSGADEISINSWLDQHLLQALEKEVFGDEPPSSDELKGMYWKEYERQSRAKQTLFKSNRTQFDIEFEHFVEQRRIDHPHEYIEHMLHRIVHSNKKVPCLIFDNADHHSIDFQHRVFQYAQSIYNNVLCLIILPITDKTSWQLTHQGAVQSFFSESFFLPTPAPSLVLRKRVEYIERKVAEQEQKAEKGAGYFFGRGIKLAVGDIKAFASSILAVLVNKAEVGYWIGNLVNHDIRQALRLTRDIMASPHMRVHELMGAAMTHTDLNIDVEHAKLAIFRGRYDIYPTGQHPFIKNLFALNTEYDTSPLLGLRILQSLEDTHHEHVEGPSRFVDIEHVTDFLQSMNIDRRVTLAWLGEMLKSGLVVSYDPRETEIAKVSRIEIAPAGHQHLVWASSDWIYIESMMEVTPLLDRDVFDGIRSLMESDLAARKRKAILTFLRYLLEEDSGYCPVPDHPQYAGQLKLVKRLEMQMRQLAMPTRTSGSSRYGRPYGRVVKWDADRHYGFIAPDGGMGAQAFVHSRDIADPDTHELAVGTTVEYDQVETEKGLKALNVVVL